MLIRLCRLGNSMVPEELRKARCRDLPVPHDVSIEYWLYQDSFTEEYFIIDMRCRIGDSCFAPELLSHRDREFIKYQYSTDDGLPWITAMKLTVAETNADARARTVGKSRRFTRDQLQELYKSLGYDVSPFGEPCTG